VLDIGSSSVRAGYAGDDTPKAVIPTAYGYILDPSQDTDVSMADPTAAADEAAKSGHKMAGIYVGNSEGPSFWRPNMHIGHPVTDGLSKYPLGLYVRALAHNTLSTRLGSCHQAY